MRFVQTIAIETEDVAPVRDLLAKWYENEAGVAPGWQHHRLLADRDRPGRYLIAVDFSSAEEAAINNDRSETAEWAAALSAMIAGDAEFVQYDEVYDSPWAG